MVNTCQVPTVVRVNLWLYAWQLKLSSPSYTAHKRPFLTWESLLPWKAGHVAVWCPTSAQVLPSFTPTPPTRVYMSHAAPGLDLDLHCRHGKAENKVWHEARSREMPSSLPSQPAMQRGDRKGTANKYVEGETQGAVWECNKGNHPGLGWVRENSWTK